MRIAVVVLSPNPDASSRVKAVLAVSKVLPGLNLMEYQVIEKGIVAQLLNPTYAAVATPKALSDLSIELNNFSQSFERVIFLKGENDPGVVEHSLLHELGHISYQQRYPEKVEQRQNFYQRLRNSLKDSNKISFLMSKVYSIVENDPKARVLLSLESDELYSNRFAYEYNTDKTAYAALAERELQIALKVWGKLDVGKQFDSAFHMVLVDLYMRVIQRTWVDRVPYMYKWMLPYTSGIVDAVDQEDPAKLFSRQILLFNAINRWMDVSEDEIRSAIRG
jgi:hypothetical protein